MNQTQHQKIDPTLFKAPAGAVNAFLDFNDSSQLLLNKMSPHSYKKKQAIYYEGNPALGVFWVQSGRVKIYKVGPEGKLYILSIANAGELLGIESIFSGEEYACSGEMLEEGIVGFIDKQVFIEVMRKDFQITLNVIKSLAKHLKTSEDERVDMAQRAVRERMARLLALLSLSHGISAQDGIHIDLKLSREDLAEMIGTAVQTAMRLLKDFKEEKLVELKGKEIIILDRKRLVQTANITELLTYEF